MTFGTSHMTITDEERLQMTMCCGLLSLYSVLSMYTYLRRTVVMKPKALSCALGDS